jgi:hypothetical protein
LRRKKQHLTVINRELRDERTPPRLACLLQLLAMVEDSESPEEKEFYKNVVVWVYGPDPKRIRWTEPDDSASEDFVSRHDAAVTEKAKSVFGAIMGASEKNNA